MKNFLKIVLVLILLFQSCYTAPELPPHMQEWPEPSTTIYTTEGDVLLMLFKVTGAKEESLHSLWWAWDDDPFSHNVKLKVSYPIETINNSFIVDDDVTLKLWNFRPGVHELKLLLHNEETGFNLKVRYIFNVDKKPEGITYVEPVVFGVRTYYNWQDMTVSSEILKIPTHF